MQHEADLVVTVPKQCKTGDANTQHDERSEPKPPFLMCRKFRN
jgi:hypothetical protein